MDRASEAMDRHARGDEAAFGEVYDHVGRPLLTFLTRLTRDRSLAEDLVQQTFLQMHLARASYSTGAPVLPWAFAIARRLAIDAFRRSRRLQAADGLELTSAGPSSPDSALEQKRKAVALQEALRGVAESHRAAFELIEYDGMSVAEAAAVLGIGESATKVRAHRVREALRLAVREVEDEALAGY